MHPTDVTERRTYSAPDIEEVRMRLAEGDRIEITNESASFIVTVQEDGDSRAEITVLEGRVTLYT